MSHSWEAPLEDLHGEGTMKKTTSIKLPRKRKRAKVTRAGDIKDPDVLRFEKYREAKPNCVVCLLLAVPPVFEPCNRCGGNLMCGDCLETYLTRHDSKCTACKKMIRLRRNQPVDSLVHHKLWKDMKKRYPKEIKARQTGQNVELFEENELRRDKLKCLVEPKEGELKAAFELQAKACRSKYEEDRRKEEAITESLLQQDPEIMKLKEALEAKEKQKRADELFVKQLLEAEKKEEEARKKREEQDAQLARKLFESEKKNLALEGDQKPAAKDHTSVASSQDEEVVHLKTTSHRKGNYKGSGPSTSPSVGTWKCSHCRVDNQAKWLRCKACNRHYLDG